MVEPIARKKISDQVFEQLKDMIKQNVFPPHSKLPSENELAKMFKVSRVPVREALRVLEAGGLIESRQGGGSIVKEIRLVNKLDSMSFELVDIVQVHQLLEMRSIIEKEAAALAAIRRTEEDLESIYQALQAFKTTISDQNIIGHELDFAYHREIVKAAANPFLLQSMENLEELYRQALLFSLMKNVGAPRKREQVYNEHLLIYEAIERCDGNAAASHMENHIKNVRLKLGNNNVNHQEEGKQNV
ncbi:FadR family transcriptional regulator [Peribacillus saganii]|uniref:FadR family transcriptional regulator n=1 Tax=Peribacillus saganii TaxID=2303992 RepID=A0A372LMZ3_9BACI|nr:FadR/GntR family transcriptional regulator [Peribacillus saganii]RFU68128.1 FadR family transcriptional regulator [Peribacillus saganii]